MARKRHRDKDVVIVLPGKKSVDVRKLHSLLSKGVVHPFEWVRVRENGKTLYEGPAIGALEILEGVVGMLSEDPTRWG